MKIIFCLIHQSDQTLGLQQCQTRAKLLLELLSEVQIFYCENSDVP